MQTAAKIRSNVENLLEASYSCDVSLDALKDFTMTIPSGVTSRTEIMGTFTHKFLVVLELFLESNLYSESKMTDKGRLRLNRNAICTSSKKSHLDGFIRQLYPRIHNDLMDDALVSTGRILLGDKYLTGGYCEAAGMAVTAAGMDATILGPSAGYLASIEASRDRFLVISSQMHPGLRANRVVGPGNYAHLQDAISYRFCDIRHLQDALSQKKNTAFRQGLSCQRLEYLGDALIDVYIVEHWIDTLPTCSASRLSRLHGQCTDRSILSAAAANLCLEQHIHFDSQKKSDKVQEIIEGLVLAKWEDRMNNVQTAYWTRVDTVDKTLCDTFESVIGAVLVDSDFDPSAANGVLKRTLRFALDVPNIFK
ncbi:Dicer-like protein 1 [Haplosporangium sp. Z 27]|nr:Dicer-like protein 1 [Haplosporangium sp. Z 27]